MSRADFKTTNGFNLCQNDITNGTDVVFLDEFINLEFNWFYWMWIVPVCSLIHIILQLLDKRGKSKFMTKHFGPQVTLTEFILGPKISNHASDNYHQKEEEEDFVPLTEIIKNP